MSIQDRTSEFRSCVTSARKSASQRSTVGASRQNLLNANGQPNEQNGAVVKPRNQRGEFSKRAADIGKQINATTGKLERLAQLAKRKTLFDDKPVEIAELTYIIKADLSQLNSSIASLQAFTRSTSASKTAAEGEHSKNVIYMLQTKLGGVGEGFKEVLEVRTKNMQASRSRQAEFVASARAGVDEGSVMRSSSSPLYQTPSHTPRPTSRGGPDLLSLDPQGGQQSTQQLLMMEDQSQSYISTRSEAITAIERTIHELSGIFGQLAQMVSEQGEQIQRIDQDTEDVVHNVEGAQRELMKYWARVSSNRWLVAKMMGVLMIFFLVWVLVS